MSHITGCSLPRIVSVRRSTAGAAVMPTALANAEHDMSYGGGVSIGAEWRPDPRSSAAVAYTTKMCMSKFTKYGDLFAGGGAFDIPASATLGLTFKPTDPIALSFDVQQIWYGGIPAANNPISNLFNCPTAGGTDVQSCLGGTRGPGFGWRNMTVYKLGLRWRLDNDWTGRFGVSHGTQPIPGSQATSNILAPGVIENHVAVGFSHRVNDSGEFNFALTYTPQKTISGSNTFEPTQTITLKMHQFVAEFGYAWMP